MAKRTNSKTWKFNKLKFVLNVSQLEKSPGVLRLQALIEAPPREFRGQSYCSRKINVVHVSAKLLGYNKAVLGNVHVCTLVL